MRNEIVALLKSSDPKERARGIKELAASGSPDALKILGAFYKRETDPKVKQYAAKVAKQLKAREEARQDEDTSFDTIAGEPAAPVSSGAVQHDPETAAVYLERAMTNLINVDMDEARYWARKAFELNPDYANDDYAVGLAAEVTRADRSIAVEELMNYEPDESTGKQKRKRKSKVDPDRVSWGSALVGVGIYAVLIGVIAFLPFGVLGSFMNTLIAAFDPSTSAAAAAEMSGALYGIAAFVAIVAIIGAIIGIFIQYGLIHFSATTFLGGDGYFTNLLYNIRIPLILQIIVQVVVLGVMMFTAVSIVGNIDPATLDYVAQTGDTSALNYLNDDIGSLNVLNGINGLISLGFTIWISIQIGKTYDFGGVKGCLSIIISRILIGVVACGCYFVLLSTLLGSANLS